MATFSKSKTIILLTISTLLAGAPSLSAQSTSPHEFSIWGGAGNTSLNIKKNTGTANGNIGFNAGIGYNIHINHQWSIGTGVEIATLGSEIKVKDIGDTYSKQLPQSANTANVVYNMGQMQEEVSINQINIPLMLQFSSRGDGHKFFAAVGGKIGLPNSKKSKSKATTFATKVTGTGINVFDEEMSRPGFDTDLELKMSTMLALEMGIKWALTANTSLYTGAYLDYGLNNILKADNRQLIDYTGTPSNNGFEHNSLFNSSYNDSQTGDTKYFVDKISPMSVGIKVRWAFQMGSNGVSNSTEVRKSGKGRNSAREKYMNNQVVKGVFDDMSPSEIQRQVDDKRSKVKKVRMQDL